MRRAKKLLKACKVLNNTPTSVIAEISSIVAYISIIAYLLPNIVVLIFPMKLQDNLPDQLFYFSMVMMMLIMKSIYTSFFTDRRKGTKNNLRELTIHLPLSKKDFVMAHYIRSLEIFFPAFIFLIVAIALNILLDSNLRCEIQLGIMILGFCISYILISLEKGICTYYYVDPRIREVSYMLLAFVWVGIEELLTESLTLYIDKMILSDRGKNCLEFVCSMGELKGIVLILGVVILGYFCQVKLPERLERSKQP